MHIPHSHMYRKPGWLWTDFHYFHKYLHNDELNSRFHMGISKYHVRATHIIHSQLQLIVTFWNIYCWTLSKITLVFGVTLDTQTYTWFSKVIMLQGFKMRLSVTYFGQDRSFSPKQPHVFIKPEDVRFDCFPHQIQKDWPLQNGQDRSF